MRINSIKFNQSHVDGPGIRTVIFMQGCNIHCKGCQNKSTWDVNGGNLITIESLVAILNKKSFNKKVTISGGEPLLQLSELRKLITLLKDNDYDIALYTGHLKEDVPLDIINSVKYLKTGSFVEKLKTTIKPYVGSTNQIFEEVNKNEIK